MKRKTGFFFDERCFWHSTGLHAVTLPVGGWVQPPAGGGHAESPETKRRMKNLMDVSGLTPQLALRSAAPASLEDLRRIHPDSYLERFKAISDNGGGMLGKEAPLGPGSYEIACLSAGLACAAVEAVLEGELDNAYSLSRPPGHHCLPDQSMGFCFLANIPIAVERAKAQLGLGKVAIIDWDVHHGNGTQHIYLQRDDVLTISLHQDGCFPPGYAESYVPFCGLAVMETLSGIRTEVQDPLREFIQQQQPRAEFAQFQRQAIDRLAQRFGLL